MNSLFKPSLAAVLSISTLSCATAPPVARVDAAQSPAQSASAPTVSPTATALRANVKRQIALLKTSQATSVSMPGGYELESLKSGEKYPAKEILALGLPALPTLAKALGDDSETTVIEPSGRVGGKGKIVKTNEIAANLIYRIAQHEFIIGKHPNETILHYSVNKNPELIPQFQELVLNWFENNANKTLAQRKISDVDDAWYGNRRDAVVWLGQNKILAARPAIERHLRNALDNPDGEKFLDWETASSALTLGQLGDASSLPLVRRACDLLSTRWKKYGVIGSLDITTLFKAYHGRALLGEKNQALRELKDLKNQVPRELEKSSLKEYQKLLQEAEKW